MENVIANKDKISVLSSRFEEILSLTDNAPYIRELIMPIQDESKNPSMLIAGAILYMKEKTNNDMDKSLEETYDECIKILGFSKKKLSKQKIMKDIYRYYRLICLNK